MTAIPLPVVAIVLFSAFCNASWNALVKSGRDNFLSAVLVAMGCGLIGGTALPFLPAPYAGSWPFIAVSVLAQIAYTTLLAATYRAGDMSQTYPVMRGLAPLLVAIASGPVIGEGLLPGRWLGIGLISLGVVGMALARSVDAPRNWRAPGFAALNAVVIATYTITDGIGVRRSGAPVSYAFWTFALTAIPLVAWTAVRRRRAFPAYAIDHWPVLVIGGVGTLLSYSLALWAMTVAPVAVIASLRETSILFATAISFVILREPVVPARLAAVAVIVAGAVVVRGF